MWLAISELQEGMILASDIKDENNKTLLPEGAKLTQSILDNLEKKGITTVDIVHDEQDPEFILRYFQNDSVFKGLPIEERIQKLFAHTDTKSTFMKNLIDFKRQKLKQMEEA